MTPQRLWVRQACRRHILLEGIHPLEEAFHHALESVPAAVAGVASLGADVVVGAVFGAAVLGVLTLGRRLMGKPAH